MVFYYQSFDKSNRFTKHVGDWGVIHIKPRYLKYLKTKMAPGLPAKPKIHRSDIGRRVSKQDYIAPDCSDIYIIWRIKECLLNYLGL